MHEASLCQGLVNVAIKALAEFQANNPTLPQPKIRELVCEAGLLTGIEETALQGCFELFIENTPLTGAKLTVNRSPLACACDACGNRFTLTKPKFFCPVCKSGEIRFSGGSGLTLQSMIADDPE